MPDMVETYAGVGAEPWWLGSSPTAKSAVMLEGDSVDLAVLQTAAGLDWTVSKQPVFVTGDHAQRVKGWNAVQRDEDGVIYGLVKDTYHLLQNSEGFAVLQTILDETDVAGITAGGLYSGAICWAMVKIDGTIYVRGDDSPIDDYLLATWGHDGRHALTVADTTVRVVCANTLSAAIGGAVGKVAIRHTPGMATKVDTIREALDIRSTYRARLIEQLDDLTTRPMTINDVKAFTEVLLPVREGIEPDRAYKTIAERDAIVSLYERSATLVGVPETAYRAYQALTEYLDHRREYRTTKTANAFDRKAEAIIDGSAFAMKSRGLALLAKS